MMSDLPSRKRWKPPFGAGSETTMPFVCALSGPSPADGADFSSAWRPVLSSLNASSFAGRTSALAPS